MEAGEEPDIKDNAGELNNIETIKELNNTKASMDAAAKKTVIKVIYINGDDEELLDIEDITEEPDIKASVDAVGVYRCRLCYQTSTVMFQL